MVYRVNFVACTIAQTNVAGISGKYTALFLYAVWVATDFKKFLSVCVKCEHFLILWCAVRADFDFETVLFKIVRVMWL